MLIGISGSAEHKTAFATDDAAVTFQTQQGTRRFAIKPQYDEARQFSDGFAAVRIGDADNGKWGFVDKRGKMVLGPQFDAVGRVNGAAHFENPG
jgi:hypothetical protein